MWMEHSVAGYRDSSWGESLARLHTTLPCCRLTARQQVAQPRNTSVSSSSKTLSSFYQMLCSPSRDVVAGEAAQGAQRGCQVTLHGAAMTAPPGPNPAASACLHTSQRPQPVPWALSLPGCTPADWERRFQLQGGQSGTMLCVWLFSLWRTGNRPEEFMAMKGEQGP